MFLLILAIFGHNCLILACPEQCRCDSRKRVYCNNRNFSLIPQNIPTDTKVLHLQDNELENSEALDLTLGRLTQLESLKLYNNKLNRMPKLNSKYLREVYLNKNRINTISSSSLENAPNLSELILDDNELSNFGIGKGAFDRLRQLRRISLIRNKLTEFPTKLPPSVNELYLTQNQISYVSGESLRGLVNLEVLYLDRNKLHDGSFVAGGFESLVNLRTLELSSNLIRHIPPRISFTLDKLHITANQLQYLRRSELDGLHNLRHLDVAYNRLRSVEHGTLEGLKNLQRVDLSGNNWSCDCYLRELKQYLRMKRVHQGSREEVTCSDAQHSNDQLDEIQENQLSCPQLKFNVSESNLKIKVESQNLKDQPPFAQYRLLYQEIHGENSTVQESVLVNPPITYTIASNLKSDQMYLICLYNSYIYRNIVDIPPSSCQQVTTSKTSDSDPVVQRSNKNSANLETIIGLVTGALIVIMTLAIVTLLCWRNKRFSMEKKYQSPIVHREVDPRALITNYPVTTQSTTSTNFPITQNGKNPEMTMDASKEFDVTLMLRQPMEGMEGLKPPLLNEFSHQTPMQSHYQTIHSDRGNLHQRQPPDQSTSRADEIGVFV